MIPKYGSRDDEMFRLKMLEIEAEYNVKVAEANYKFAKSMKRTAIVAAVLITGILVGAVFGLV